MTIIAGSSKHLHENAIMNIGLSFLLTERVKCVHLAMHNIKPFKGRQGTDQASFSTGLNSWALYYSVREVSYCNSFAGHHILDRHGCV